MSRIQYIACMSGNPDALAGFYTRHLGLRELGRNAEGDVSLTDGAINLSLMRPRANLREPRLEAGWHHLGIAVKSIAEIEARYRAFNPRGVFVRESGDLQHGEARICDPECNPVTLCERGFGLPEPERAVPGIAHVALNALDTEAIFNFYTEVFGFRELTEAHAARRKEAGYRNKHVGDGFTNVAIQAFYNEEEGFEPRFGVAHIGFLVKDSRALAEEIRGVATITERPASRQQSEVRMRDPDGNGCDLSQRGWEVDIGKWVGNRPARAT